MFLETVREQGDVVDVGDVGSGSFFANTFDVRLWWKLVISLPPNGHLVYMYASPLGERKE